MTKSTFIDYIRSEYMRTKSFPKIPELSEHFTIPQYKISRMLKSLSEEGALIRWNNWYRLPEQMDDIEITSTTTGSVLNETPAPIEDDKIKSIESASPYQEKESRPFLYNVFTWILFAIGIGAAIMSAYYTKIFLSDSIPIFFAWFLSILMVAFSVIAFSLVALTASGSFTKHWSRFFLIAIFSFLWVVTAGYSIVSTVAGQYNKRVENTQAVLKIENDSIIDAGKIKLEQETRKDFIARRDDARERLRGLFEAADKKLADPDSLKDTWEEIQSRILATQKIISELDIKIEDSRAKEKMLLENNPMATQSIKKQSSFFKWISTLFNGNEDIIQFWMSVFPALFLDIIAPVMLSLFVFMRKKKDIDLRIV